MRPYINTTYNFGWQNFSVDYTVECCKCHKISKKVVSTGCNKMASTEYINDLYEKLSQEAAKLSHCKDFVCNQCLLKTIDFNFQNSVDINCDKIFQDSVDIYEKVAVLGKELNILTKQLNGQYRNRIVKYDNKLWIIDYISSNAAYQYCDGITCAITKLNEKKPWLETNTRLYSIKLTDLEIFDKFLKDIQPKV